MTVLAVARAGILTAGRSMLLASARSRLLTAAESMLLTVARAMALVTVRSTCWNIIVQHIEQLDHGPRAMVQHGLMNQNKRKVSWNMPKIPRIGYSGTHE
jgi:hypothetical protein